MSVGNLRVGGSGKTPIVEYIARLLVERGERPAVLTRGVRAARARRRDDRVGRHDRPRRSRRGGRRAADARAALPGVAVLVGADRYLSGCLAERRLGATVHLLDDGFQHLELARDVDLLLVAEDDLQDRPLPAGRCAKGSRRPPRLMRR